MDEPTYDLDATRTPQPLFDALFRKYKIRWDLFASADNSKMGEAHYSKEDSAFDCDWPTMETHDYLFSNPPYGRGQLPRFVKKALEQVKRGCAIVSLIPATPGTEWFNDGILRRCDTLEGYTVDEGPLSGYCLSMQGIGYRQTVTFLKGRVPFDPPIGYPPEKEWNPPATDSIVWTLRPPLR